MEEMFFSLFIVLWSILMEKVAWAIKNTFLAFATASLVGCGGGETVSDSDPAVLKEMFEESGVWRRVDDTSITLNESLETSGGKTHLAGSATMNSKTVYSIDNTGSQVLQTYCNVYPPLVVVYDDAFRTYGTCDDLTEKYVKISDSQYRKETRCKGSITVLNFTKISDSTEFNFGSLSFTAVKHSGLGASTSVCGSLWSRYETRDFTPDMVDLPDYDLTKNYISVVAPYNGSKILLELSFLDAINIDSYTVVEHQTLNSQVEVSLISTAFGGTLESPYKSDAVSGSVTINTIEDYSASGTFNITLDDAGDNDVISGSFSFDIEGI
jgi:hypothetical protein